MFEARREMHDYRLPHSAVSVAKARSLAQEAASRLARFKADDFSLMVTEAVSNAILHAPPMADGRIGLRFETHDGVVRGVVTDGGTTFVPNPEASAEAEPRRHFGLRIIDALSSRWGVTVDGVTNVWFEVNGAGSD
jgi:serine/threonine-protein kinase RsbW